MLLIEMDPAHTVDQKILYPLAEGQEEYCSAFKPSVCFKRFRALNIIIPRKLLDDMKLPHTKSKEERGTSLLTHLFWLPGYNIQMPQARMSDNNFHLLLLPTHDSASGTRDPN